MSDVVALGLDLGLFFSSTFFFIKPLPSTVPTTNSFSTLLHEINLNSLFLKYPLKAQAWKFTSIQTSGNLLRPTHQVQSHLKRKQKHEIPTIYSYINDYFILNNLGLFMNKTCIFIVTMKSQCQLPMYL